MINPILRRLTMGPEFVLDIVRGIASLDQKERENLGSDSGAYWGEGFVAVREGEVLAQAHIWAAVLEPVSDLARGLSYAVRESLLGSISIMSEVLEVGQVAGLYAWLQKTGTDRSEMAYMETFRRIIEQAGVTTPTTHPDPHICAQSVDLLRGITSTLAEERTRAAGYVPAALERYPSLAEKSCLCGVLARAAVEEHDSSVRLAQLEALTDRRALRILDDRDRALLLDTLTTRELDPPTAALVDRLNAT